MRYLKFSFFFFLFLFVAESCLAAEKIVVTPAFQEISLEVNEIEAGEIEIQNQTGTNQEFQVRAVGFRSLDLSGGVAFLGSDINNENLFSVDFITFENTNFSVPAGEKRTFSFEVKDQAALAPGGNYAALIFQSLPVKEENTNQKIAVRQIFSALLFIEKIGGATKQIEITDFPVKRLSFIFPESVTFHFKNTGNTHIAPRGILQLEKPFGRKESCGVINEASSVLLPGQERVFFLSQKCHVYLPGYYQWHLAYRYDGVESFAEIKKELWYFPYQGILVIGGGVVLLLLLKKKGFKFPRRKNKQ